MKYFDRYFLQEGAKGRAFMAPALYLRFVDGDNILFIKPGHHFDGTNI